MHILYGVKSAETAAVAAALSDLLDEPLHERESSYLGDYWLGRVGDSKVKVVEQPDPGGEPLDEAFGEYRVLIYVDGSTPVPRFSGLAVADDVIVLLREK